MLILTMILSLPPSSSSAGPSLVFTADSPGYAELEDVSVDGSLSLSLSFKTGASEGQLFYMRELTTGHQISLSLTEGALHLQVHPDTLIIPRTEDTGDMLRLDDQEWHKVYLNLNGGHFQDIAFNVDHIEIFPGTSAPFRGSISDLHWRPGGDGGGERRTVCWLY